MSETLLDNLNYRLIGYKMPCVNKRLNLASKLAAALDSGSYISPVEIAGILYLLDIFSACVPLPAPGAPSKISLIISLPNYSRKPL